MRNISKMPRTLEIKTRLWGFEIADILVIFLNLAVMNFIFGGSGFKGTFLIWGASIFLALFLFFIKRGKPDSYVLHCFQFIAQPGSFDAGMPDQEFQRYFSQNRETRT